MKTAFVGKGGSGKATLAAPGAGSRLVGVGNPLYERRVGRSGFVKAAERGRHLPIGEPEAADAAASATMRAALDACAKDWVRRAARAADFHTRNAVAWGNARAGTDLTAQIDPDFILRRAATAAVH